MAEHDPVYETVGLKPCPFCGSDAIFLNTCTLRTMCRNCFASGPLIGKVVKRTGADIDDATKAWNTRSGSDG